MNNNNDNKEDIKDGQVDNTQTETTNPNNGAGNIGIAPTATQVIIKKTFKKKEK